jgi:hypothetical protein
MSAHSSSPVGRMRPVADRTDSPGGELPKAATRGPHSNSAPVICIYHRSVYD